MKTPKIRPGERVGPRQQHNWDWRAASNFIAGGTGGGLLAFAAFASLWGADVRALLVAGMALIGAGLTCVWFEIGKPWRALNVYRHAATSWMTREAAVAPFVFGSGVLALATGLGLFVLLTGIFGACFVYAQARILAADKGIPAWRHRRCLPLVAATGFAEGASLLAVATPFLIPHVAGQIAVATGALVLLFVRVLLWRNYLRGLRSEGAPVGSLRALSAIDGPFLKYGNLLPAALLLVGVLGTPLAGAALVLAGLVAVAGGWWFKYTLVRRAAFTQGFALPHLPVRGRGTSGAGVKPGWGGA
ncbi:dimethyl sulfoxide reductase anchor subunit [Aromatoleum toluclasticum]|uniref:DmsC/YnfH family molybdoenzyme membrane anchor subunit n=1 Tax=Aromatoleum toluclasticum TaxID=92003 RepID=UPI001D17FD66|nr:DmsC/YnfH family molybdoenzyme membrane anchor subunit [Aromatoleum toluclasticum]MCC4115943.1 dimethyl sulfoxide reductase anchor subunit [Aromatoleum toluclasticum]